MRLKILRASLGYPAAAVIDSRAYCDDCAATLVESGAYTERYVLLSLRAVYEGTIYCDDCDATITGAYVE